MTAFTLWTFVLGLVLGSTTLILAIVPVGVYLAFSAFGAHSHLRIAINRVLPDGQIYEGEEVRVSMRVLNEGPEADLEILDQVPDGAEVTRGSNHVFVALKKGEARNFIYSLSPQLFGTYTLGPIKVRVTDRYSARYEATAFESYGVLRIYPEVKYLSRVELRHPHPRNWPGETITRRAGQGLEFYGIREHSPGEPIRRINWKATARIGSLMINQYMGEAGGETLIVLDSRTISSVGVPPDTTAAYSVRAAAALSYRLLRDRNRVGLFAVGRNLVKIPVGSGRRQFDRLMIGMISTSAEASGTEEWSLDLAPQYIPIFFARTVQIILISSFVDSMPISVVSDLARAGYSVLVISPSPLRLDTPYKASTREIGLAMELAKIERKEKLSIMESHAQVIDWNPSTPLIDALEGSRGTWRNRRFN
jgi:uncharacterized protein (DUF58 family)